MSAKDGNIDSGEGFEFALSRALYRRLGDGLLCDSANRRRILDACETTMRRLVTDRYFARPARFLFEEIRFNYPLDEQLWVRRTIESNVNFALQILDRLPPPKRECPSFTRAGTPCRREPVQGSEYCPSHRHLESLDVQLDETSAGI